MFRAHLFFLCLCRSPMPVCVRVSYASRFLIFIRGSNRCVTKNCLLSSRLYGFIIFFLLPTTHTKQLHTSDPNVFTANIRTMAFFFKYYLSSKKEKRIYIYINIYKLLSACPTPPPLSPRFQCIVGPKRLFLFWTSILLSFVCRYNTTPFYAPVLLSVFFLFCQKPKIYILGWVYIHIFHFKKENNLYWIRIIR